MYYPLLLWKGHMLQYFMYRTWFECCSFPTSEPDSQLTRL